MHETPKYQSYVQFQIQTRACEIPSKQMIL